MHKTYRAVWVVAVALWLLAASPSPVPADDLSDMLLREVLQPGIDDGSTRPLLDPPPLEGSWSATGYRPLGVNLGDYNLEQHHIDAAGEMGCKLVRIPIPMENFLSEAEPDWATLDRVVSRLDRAGIDVVPVLTANSAVPGFYLEFCKAVATRYAASFDYYQLLDDVNLMPGLYTKDYSGLLKKAQLEVLLADPGARIICGGIRGVDITYLEMLERSGAIRHVDVLAFNLYPDKGAIEEVVPGFRSDHSLPLMEQAVEWAQARGKEVWVTSFGVSTCYTSAGVDQVTQAAYYSRGALLLGRYGASHILFASLQDTDPTYSTPIQCTGMLDVSGNPKASHIALAGLNRCVNGAYNTAQPFVVQGYTFQRPEAEELLVKPRNDLPDYEALADYRAYGLDVYAYWFYAPREQEYRMVYWLEKDTNFETLLTINVYHNGLTPLERYILLDSSGTMLGDADYFLAPNLLYFPYQPVGDVPCVVRFEVNENGRPH